MWWFVGGIWLGTIFGFVIASLLTVGKYADREDEDI